MRFIPSLFEAEQSKRVLPKKYYICNQGKTLASLEKQKHHPTFLHTFILLAHTETAMVMNGVCQ